MAPVLNRYIKDKFPKDYKGSGVYAELSKQLEDFLRLGEKGTKLTHKFIVKTIMARLGQYEYLPPGMLALTIACFYSEDRRLARCGFYLAQRLVGCGAAGTPIPVPPGDEVYLAAGALTKADVVKAWPDVDRPDANPFTREFQMRLLAAAARANPDCVNLAGDAIKGLLLDCGIDPKSKKGAGTASPKVSAAAQATLLKAAFGAARVALPAKPSTLSLVSKRAFHGVDSLNAVTARHALALLAQLAVTDPSTVDKDIRNNVGIALNRYVNMRTFDVATAVREKQAVGVNMDDTLARVYLARVCGMTAQLEKKDSDGVYFKLLHAFAVKDPSEYVAMEAIKSLAGHTLPLRHTLDLDVAHPHAEAQAMKRAKAWSLLLRQCEVPKGDPAAGQPPKLMIAVRVRLRRALQLDAGIITRASMVCGALRSAAALAEARARHVASTPPPPGNTVKGMASKAVDVVMEQLQQDVATVLDGVHYGPAARSLALVALIWMQKPNAPQIITPERMYNCVTAGGGGASMEVGGQVDPWPQECLQPVMYTLQQAAKAMPSTVQYRLECAVALAHGAPARVGHDALLDLWKVAVQGKPYVRNTAIASALALLNSNPPPGASVPAGAPHAAVMAAAAEDAAWVRLQKLAAWWLGEYANQASGEWAGQHAAKPENGSSGNGSHELGLTDEGTHNDGVKANGTLNGGSIPVARTNAELLMLEASRSPMMVTLLGALQRAITTGSWHVRVAAVEALGKIAVRSPEPYRIYCYTVLNAVSRGQGKMNRDVLGVLPAAQPMLEVLDMVYEGSETVDKMAQEYGMQAVNWPDAALADLRTLHETILARAEAVVGKLPVAGGFPLGPTSRALLTTDVEEERKQKEEDEVKRNPDKWKAVEDSDSEESEFEREPAPWDRADYSPATQSGNPWEAERQAAPWESRPPWERDAEAQAAADDDDDDSDVHVVERRVSGNPWETSPAAEANEPAPLPWERREPAPWEKYTATPAESSDDEDAYSHNQDDSYAYDEAITTVKDDYWDALNGSPALELPKTASTLYDPYVPAATTYNEYSAAADYSKPLSTPVDSDDEASPAIPKGVGIVRHEFESQGEEELTVEVGDKVDVLDDNEGWLLCRHKQTGAMGLVPATYVEMIKDGPTGVAGGSRSHKREPSLGAETPWDDATPSPEAASTASKGRHRREPTFEFEEERGAAGGDAAMPGETNFEFGSPLPIDDVPKGRRGKVVYAFDAQDPEELTVAPGDSVIIHNEVDGWYTATRLADGTQGLVPCSYVEVDE